MAQTKLTFAPLALALGATLALAASCTVQARPRVQSAGYVSVGPGQTYTVQSMPPQPLYEQQSASPGYGHVWIDGSWHWSGSDWQWSRGHWVRDRADYVYIAPYYDYNGSSNVYTRGYWQHRSRVPNHYQGTTRTTGRPAIYRQPRRSPVVDHRGNTPPPRTGVTRPTPPRGVAPSPRPVAPRPGAVRPTAPRPTATPPTRGGARPAAPVPGRAQPPRTAPPRTTAPPTRGGARPAAPTPGRAQPPRATPPPKPPSRTTAPVRGGSRPAAPAPRRAKPTPDRVRHNPSSPR